MGEQKKARKYVTMKRMLSLRDQSALKETEVPQHPSCLFFQYYTQLGPPHHILVDTNFINFSIKAKLVMQSIFLCACWPWIQDLKDCHAHKGTYADDCLVQSNSAQMIQKIPGVPNMYISNHRYNIERMPDDYGAPWF
ncbi:unnamed protein product [Nyctereutes procyonoides]|uniref:(raccoon dog) hypothetical protein n=1 Tax=Nyctereutes procyonoides TaxID=34880 RepID=A0A811ZZ51_NYCPR|nr:unnamed protein product [Nyctereutes procyonoides]